MRFALLLIVFVLAFGIYGCCGAATSPTSEAMKISKEAERQNDSSLCERIEIPYWKDDCYAGVAMTTDNVSLCDKMEDQITRGGCYSETAQDLAVCNRIDNQDIKDACYAHVAKIKKDPAICDSIQNQIWKTRCYTDAKSV
jgi:hypothetical protein